MSDTTRVCYEIARAYVQDQQWESEDIRNRLLGAIRARRLDILAQSMSLFDPHLHGIDSRRQLMQVEAFFKKNVNFTAGEAAAQASLASFKEAECICAVANQRLETFYLQPELFAPDLQLKVSRMVKFIDRTLGRFGDFRRKIPSMIRVTPGATSTSSRRKSLPYLKVSKKMSAPRGAHKYLQALSHTFGYGDLKISWTNVNRVEMVPKNWKTDRVIACEPDGALPLQLAFDHYAKRRLRRVGVDLSDQSWNQRLAYASSVANDLATIDLSMASDTLAYNAVALLLPYEWFQYLNDIRSSAFRLPNGERGTYAKFSSMGNGATFALETLIFRAACEAVGSDVNAVYGDDIVIEQCLAKELIELLGFLGFRPNVDKSYFTGPFRESCGVNYYNGIDITPVYVRKLDNTKSSKCVLINGLASIATPGGRLATLLKTLVSEWRLRLVPWTESAESGIWVDASTAYSQGLIQNKHGSLRFKSYVRKDKKMRAVDSRTLFLWYLMKMSSTGPEVGNTRAMYELGRGFVTRYHLRHILAMAETGCISTTEVPLLTHKYVSKWVSWFPPRQVSPVHLYWWADYLTANAVS